MTGASKFTLDLHTIIRFLKKIDDTKGSCWNWTDHTQQDGYGVFSFYLGKSRTYPVVAHRVSYWIFRGEIPQGLQLDHLCRNRVCVNPEHLEAVTCKENILRGNGLCAQNSKKTHCPQGHEYNETNTRYDKNGGRYCRPCGNATQKRYQQRKREMNYHD